MGLYAKHSKSLEKAVALLKETALFQVLADTQLEVIASQLSRRTFGPGVTLFHQGMPGTTLYIIEEGSVRVYGVGLTGQEHTFNTFGRGNIFGELALLDGKARTASAITQSQTTVWTLQKEDLNRFLTEYPVLCRRMVTILTGRVRQSATHIESIIFQDVLGRVAFELITLAEQQGIPADKGIEITMPLTQSDLATFVGATRESVNKALSQLRRRDLLVMEGTRIILPDPDGLMDLVGRRGR